MKPLELNPVYPILPIHPRTGVWIETEVALFPLENTSKFTPARGCGLKPGPTPGPADPPSIHPRTGVWIETSIPSGPRRRPATFTPARGCGLKRWSKYHAPPIFRFTPARGCGLKPLWPLVVCFPTSFTPARGCGLKLVDTEQKERVTAYSPPHGGVD